MGYMDFINKASMQRKGDILSSFDWELVCITKPKACYYPGDLVIRGRTNSVDLPPDLDVENAKTEMRGYTVLSPGKVTNTGTFSINFQDFEDQAMTAFFLDLIYKTNNPLTRRSLRKEDLVSDWDFYRLNVNREPVRACRMRTCLVSGGTMGDVQDTEKAPIQKGKIDFDIQLYWWENLN